MATLFTLLPLHNFTATGSAPLSAAGGMNTWLDLNADGWDDYVFTGAFYPNQGGPSQVSDQPGWLGLGSALGLRIAPQAEFPGAGIGSVHAREILSADFNGDRIPDLFIADHGYDAMPFPGHVNQLFLSVGAGGWRNASANLPRTPDFTHSAATGDADGDGDVDVFVGNTALGHAYFLLNDGAGQFTQDRSRLPSGGVFEGLYFESCLLVDLDGDGLSELVLGSRFDRERHVLWNHGGSWAAGDATALPVPADVGSQYTILDIQSTDVNFDGRPDLLMDYQTTNGGWRLSILINEGGRQFSDRTAEFLVQPGAAAGGLGSQTVQPSMEFLRPLDLNGDGRMDFFTTPVAVRPATPDRGVPVFLLQREDGRFDVVTTGALLDAGLEPGLLNGLEYARHEVAGEGSLVSHYQDGSTVFLSAHTLQWLPRASTWHAGTAASDLLVGGSGADWFGPLGGNDRVDGGAGIDRVIYPVARSDLTALPDGAGGWQVSGSRVGQDTLVGIERLQFTDGHLALDLAGHAGLVARIIGALLGPAHLSNRTYVGMGLDLLDAGMAYADLVDLVIRTDEFAALAGDRSNAAFVAHVYRNVVGTAPSTAQATHFEGLLAGGAHSQASLGLLACDSELTATRIDLTGLASVGLPFLPVQGD